MNIGTLTVSLGVNSTGLIAAQGAIDNFAKRAETSLNRVAQRFRTFGYLASAVVTYPIIMMGKSIINTAKDFEFSMAKIVGLVGLSKKEVDSLSESILKLAPIVVQTPQALADALYFITSAGIKDPAKAMDVLTISAKAATAGMGETADIAKLLVFSLNAYKNTGLTASKAADMMTVAIREGAIEAEGFASAIQQVIPIASNMGVSLGQVMGTMAAMSLQGANAANSAVYLKGILNSLMKIKPTNQAGKALAELGSSALKLRAQLAEGPNGLMNVLLQIQEWSKTNPYLLNKVFGNVRSMTGDLSLMGKNLVANQKVINQTVNAYGDLNKASVAVADTIKVRLKTASIELNSGLTTLGKTIAKDVIPVYEKLVQHLSNMIKWFDSLTESSQRFILKTIALIAALGPLSLLTSLLIYSFSGFIVVINKVIGVIELLRLGLLSTAGPYVLIGAALIAAVGYLIHFKHKSEDAAKAQLDFNKALVTVNGNIKKMKDLTSLDFSAMNFNEIFAIKTEAQANWKTALDNVIKKYEEVGVSVEQYNNAIAIISKKKLYSKEDIKNAEDILGKTKKYTSYINQQTEVAKANKDIVNMADKALVVLADNWEKNARASAINSGIIIDDLGEQVSAIQKVIDQYIEETRYIEMMNKISKGGKLFEFDINTAKLELAQQTLEDFVKEVSKVGGTDVLSSLGGGMAIVGNALDLIIQGLIKQITDLKQVQETIADAKMLHILQSEADAFGGIAGKVEVVNYALQAAQRTLRSMFTAKEKGIPIDEEKIKRTVEEIKTLKTQLVELQNSVDLTYLLNMNNALHNASTESNLFSGYISALENRLKNLSENGLGASDTFKILAKQLQTLNYAQEAIDILSQSFDTLFRSVLDGAKDFGTTLVNIFKNIIAQIVSKFIKAQIIKLIFAILNPEAAAAIGGLKIVSGFMGFGAKGGIVPAGYPHDTYPAMLSSGEQIIPARASLSNIESAKHNINITLDGSIYGKDMKLFIRRIYES